MPVNAKISMVLKNDRQALQAGVKTCNVQRKDRVRIRSTLQLQEMEESETLLAEVGSRPQLSVYGQPYSLPFDSGGNLLLA